MAEPWFCDQITLVQRASGYRPPRLWIECGDDCIAIPLIEQDIRVGDLLRLWGPGRGHVPMSFAINDGPALPFTLSALERDCAIGYPLSRMHTPNIHL